MAKKKISRGDKGFQDLVDEMMIDLVQQEMEMRGEEAREKAETEHKVRPVSIQKTCRRLQRIPERCCHICLRKNLVTRSRFYLRTDFAFSSSRYFT